MSGRSRNDLHLQSTLAGASATTESAPIPHHPITCPDRLRLLDDNSLACDHATVGPDDVRTNHCIDHSIAMLLIELALDREFPK